MKKKKKAHEIYTTERLNCAQSILKEYKDSHNVAEEKIDDFIAFGSGRAKNNMCGALYAALELIDEQDAKDSLAESFIKRTGSSKCSDIRKAKVTSCVDCVRIASELVDSIQ